MASVPPIILVTTAVKYDVVEEDLKAWLKEVFKDDAKYEVCRSLWLQSMIIMIKQLASDESGTGFWRVTAPRMITAVSALQTLF